MTRRFLSDYLIETFGTKVYKLSLSSGCTCPNRDGTLGTGGCSFCSEGGSGDFAAPLLPVGEQIRAAKALVDPKFPSRIPPEERKYIAYFQSYTNTYGSPVRLRELYHEAISYPEIAALSIGTRPDCIPDEILEMLKELNRVKPVWVELGLQTVHERTAGKFRRGYELPAFEDAYMRLKEAGITVIVHVILGLPGESEEDMLETVRYLASLPYGLDGIKLQLLHVLKGTELGEKYLVSPFKIMTLEEYSDLIVKCLDLLPEETVIHRLTGDAPKRLLIAPEWSGDKKRVLNTIRAKLRR
ncbi:MAG: TIGR01212 family radical SAM protein [Lachnospiraceae bacterium]|nr:TIGR01212 family radical SAM protein [Lachnospiraceae bacterium]